MIAANKRVQLVAAIAAVALGAIAVARIQAFWTAFRNRRADDMLRADAERQLSILTTSEFLNAYGQLVAFREGELWIDGKASPMKYRMGRGGITIFTNRRRSKEDERALLDWSIWNQETALLEWAEANDAALNYRDNLRGRGERWLKRNRKEARLLPETAHSRDPLCLNVAEDGFTVKTLSGVHDYPLLTPTRKASWNQERTSNTTAVLSALDTFADSLKGIQSDFSLFQTMARDCLPFVDFSADVSTTNLPPIALVMSLSGDGRLQEGKTRPSVFIESGVLIPNFNLDLAAIQERVQSMQATALEGTPLRRLTLDVARRELAPDRDRPPHGRRCGLLIHTWYNLDTPVSINPSLIGASVSTSLTGCALFIQRQTAGVGAYKTSGGLEAGTAVHTTVRASVVDMVEKRQLVAKAWESAPPSVVRRREVFDPARGGWVIEGNEGTASDGENLAERGLTQWLQSLQAGFAINHYERSMNARNIAVEVDSLSGKRSPGSVGPNLIPTLWTQRRWDAVGRRAD